MRTFVGARGPGAGANLLQAKAHHLYAGAAFDSMGHDGKKLIHVIAAIVNEYPRGDVNQQMAICYVVQATQCCDSRISLLVDKGFYKMILRSPFGRLSD